MTSHHAKEGARLRREVQKRLGRPVSQAIWNYLDEERILSNVLDGEDDVDLLIGHVQRLQEVQDEGSRNPSPGFLRKQRRTAGVSLWREAQSAVLAAMARERNDVRTFRDGDLRGKILQPSDVDQWIIDTGTRDYEPDGGWITLDKPAERIEYFKPSSNEIVSRALGQHRGVLRRLHELSQALVRDLDWLPYQATMFVLSDDVPVVTGLRYNVEDRDPYFSLSHIVLKVNPCMTPRELAKGYADIRQRVVGQKKPGRIGKKHARLAVYVSGIQKPELTHADMANWNRQNPQWAYERFSNFSRDWKVTRRRLLGLYSRFPDPRTALFGK